MPYWEASQIGHYNIHLLGPLSKKPNFFWNFDFSFFRLHLTGKKQKQIYLTNLIQFVIYGLPGFINTKTQRKKKYPKNKRHKNKKECYRRSTVSFFFLCTTKKLLFGLSKTTHWKFSTSFVSVFRLSFTKRKSYTYICFIYIIFLNFVCVFCFWV
jgi:hypothetical protein